MDGQKEKPCLMQLATANGWSIFHAIRFWECDESSQRKMMFDTELVNGSSNHLLEVRNVFKFC
jgi:hypothetical protein